MFLRTLLFAGREGVGLHSPPPTSHAAGRRAHNVDIPFPPRTPPQSSLQDMGIEHSPGDVAQILKIALEAPLSARVPEEDCPPPEASGCQSAPTHALPQSTFASAPSEPMALVHITTLSTAVWPLTSSHVPTRPTASVVAGGGASNRNVLRGILCEKLLRIS